MYTDLLTQIKNAETAKKESLKVRYSKMDFAIAELLERHGFLKKVEVKGRTAKRIMEIETNPKRAVRGVKFLSKPSRRLFGGYRSLRGVKGGEGLIVVTTPGGIMTGAQAKKAKVGGELLFEIW